MLSQLVAAAENGTPVYVPDVRTALKQSASGGVEALLVLPDGIAKKRFSIPVPPVDPLTEAERAFLSRYIRAEIYNHLTTLGGFKLTLYYDQGRPGLEAMLQEVIGYFQIDVSRGERSGYGRIVNVLDRMNDALHPKLDAESRRFVIELRPLGDAPLKSESVRFRAEPEDIYRRVTRNLEGKSVCGLDIGGTDIKAALTVDGRLVALKEYDWNPAAYKNVEEISEPIVLIVRLLRARAALETAMGATRNAATEALRGQLTAAFDPHADLETMSSAVQSAEEQLGDLLSSFDAIGLCFPDVVVKNRIVGGEVPKTRGMRSNAARNFEEQFAALSRLDQDLEKLCKPGGVVMNTNDGPMAAFTAAVELAASPTPELGANGVFAHTLGTDLGTGLALADGSIPEIPLEVYNLVLDIGSDAAARLPAEDLRSLANTNTGIPGTPQKLASQAGAFRLADKLIWGSVPELQDGIVAEGFVVEKPAPQEKGATGNGNPLRIVPESPVDQRKPYLAYLMALAKTDNTAAEIFRTIGEYMAVVYEETEHLLETGLTQRFLFGRFVKVARCFELICEGAATRAPDLSLIAADSSMAYTPLMRALDADPDYTVAQFGQAIGAVYFGNLGLIRPKLAD